MRTPGPVAVATDVIDVDLTQLSFVDNTISLRGEGTAGSWYYVGGVLDGSTFHAVEVTGGIAENAPDVCLVDGRLFNKLEMSRLPSSTSRNPQLRQVVDQLQEVMSDRLEEAVARDLDKGSS